MKPTTTVLKPDAACRRRDLEVRRFGAPPTRSLRVEVRREALTPAQEDQLTRLTALQRLEQVRRRVEALRRWHERKDEET